MENQKVFFKETRNFLIEFEYPLASSMKNEEFGEIFFPGNRCFLVSWLLELIIPKLEDNQKSIEKLGELLYNYGFCLENEKKPFMEATLKFLDQVNIFKRIFTLIRPIKKSTNTLLNSLSFEDMENISKPTNLFPMLGKIKLLTQTGKTNNENKVNYNILENNELLEETYSDLSITTDDIQSDICLIKSAAEACSGEYNYTLINEDISHILKKCNDDLKIIVQFTKDINLIEDFQKNNDDILKEECKQIEKDYKLGGICQEICSILRNNNIN